MRRAGVSTAAITMAWQRPVKVHPWPWAAGSDPAARIGTTSGTCTCTCTCTMYTIFTEKPYFDLIWYGMVRNPI